MLLIKNLYKQFFFSSVILFWLLMLLKYLKYEIILQAATSYISFPLKMLASIKLSMCNFGSLVCYSQLDRTLLHSECPGASFCYMQARGTERLWDKFSMGKRTAETGNKFGKNLLSRKLLHIRLEYPFSSPLPSV